MAGLLPSSHPNLFSVDLKTLRHSSPSFPTTITVPLSSSSGWIPSRVLRFRCPEAGKARRIRIDRSPSGDDEEPCPPSRVIPDEWGERSEPEVEPPAEADTPMDEDEWGREVIPGEDTTVAGVTDEWGEKTEPEPEPEKPLKPDSPVLKDEWGNSIPAVDDKLGDLKRCLVDTVYGTELGLRASADVRAEILELVNQLEAHNPTSAPNNAPELLDGNWILLYTAFSELLPLLAIGGTPLLKIKKISQFIDSKGQTIVNAATLASPFSTFSFSVSASFEVRSPSRIQVQFKEGAFRPPEVSPTPNLPEKVEIFGQKIDLKPVQESLTPIQNAAANVLRSISGQPPLKVPIPGDRAQSWLLTTYLDKDFRISRGDGGIFLLAKEGSPLLDQLS